MSESNCQAEFVHKGKENWPSDIFGVGRMVSGRGSTNSTLDNSVAHKFNQVGNEEPNELMCYPVLQPEKHLGSVGA